ncbi:MAG: hypothetical protein JSV80_08870, partial [Acidobacteriota bacterium]
MLNGIKIALLGAVCVLSLLAPSSLVADDSPLPDGWKVTSKGAQIHGADGVFVDAEDMVYITSVMGREIVVYDPTRKEIVDRIGPERGVESPDDLFVTEDGTIYLTSILSGEVIRLRPDGGWDKQVVAPLLNPITMSDDGRLFTARSSYPPGGLYELDPELLDPPRVIIADGLGGLNAFEFGPDGYLYAPLFTEDKVIKIDVDSCDNATDPWNECDIQIVTDGFEGRPVAVRFDSAGRLHALDVDTGALYRIDVGTGEKTLITDLIDGVSSLGFDSKDTLYVTSHRHGNLFILKPNEDPESLLRGGAIVPGSITVVPREGADESLLVADLYSVREYDSKTGRDLDYFYWDHGLGAPFTAAYGGGQLVLTSWWDGGWVRVCDPSTFEVLDEDTAFPYPANAIPFAGDVAVSSPYFGAVVRMSDHAVLGSGLYLPSGLAATDDDLWVADWWTGVIWQIVQDGEVLDPKRFVAFGLSQPEGLALDLDGSLLVV